MTPRGGTQVLERLEGLVQSLWPASGMHGGARSNPPLQDTSVAVFGSYASGLGAKGGDVDAVIEGTYNGRPLQEAPRDVRKDVLGTTVRALRRCGPRRPRRTKR